MLVSADLFVCGIATIIQSGGIGKIFGVRLPVVAGATFAVLSPMIIIAQAVRRRSGRLTSTGRCSSPACSA